METVALGRSSLHSSRLAYGCWRIADGADPAELTQEKAAAGKNAIQAAYEAGYTFFDHADIYPFAETLFCQVLKNNPEMRERVTIATKCGVRKAGEPWSDSPHRYDSSAEYIIKSCEGSLQRLGVDTIDLFQLQRPDYLCNPEDVAEAFEKLMRSGKVQEFGVCNFRPTQMAMLQKFCSMPLVSHQAEMSLARIHPFEDGTLDLCLAERMTPLAWSPLGGGVLGTPEKLDGIGPRHTVSAHLQETLHAIAEARGISRSIVAIAWLLKHPACIVPIIGSTDPRRIRDVVGATEVELTRDEWYRLLHAARTEKLP